MLRPDLLARLELLPRPTAQADRAADRPAAAVATVRAAAADIDRQLPLVARNMALAATQEQRGVTAVFDELQARKRTLAAEVAAAERAGDGAKDAETAVGAAMSVASRPTDISADPDNFSAAGSCSSRSTPGCSCGSARCRRASGCCGRRTAASFRSATSRRPSTFTRGRQPAKKKGAAASLAAALGDAASPASLIPKSPGSEEDSLGNVK